MSEKAIVVSDQKAIVTITKVAEIEVEMSAVRAHYADSETVFDNDEDMVEAYVSEIEGVEIEPDYEMIIRCTYIDEEDEHGPE